MLYRWNLDREFEQRPEAALVALRDKALADPGGRSGVFALAELCFEQADRTGRRDYYLGAAVYAYAFLFPGVPDERLAELDPRARIAADLAQSNPVAIEEVRRILFAHAEAVCAEDRVARGVGAPPSAEPATP